MSSLEGSVTGYRSKDASALPLLTLSLLALGPGSRKFLEESWPQLFWNMAILQAVYACCVQLCTWTEGHIEEHTILIVLQSSLGSLPSCGQILCMLIPPFLDYLWNCQEGRDVKNAGSEEKKKKHLQTIE